MNKYMYFGFDNSNECKNFMLIACLMLINFLIIMINGILFVLYFETKQTLYLVFGGANAFVTVFALFLTYKLYCVLHRKNPPIDIYIDQQDLSERNDFFIPEEIETV